ncbi:MAG: hypothetical protein CL917_17310 [Deltaproteobacteria bacterium]|nr:hypothetical protein [Deltaproteobacteria bacterium]
MSSWIGTGWAVLGLSLIIIFALDLLLRLVLSDGRENDHAVDRLRAELVEVNDFAAPLLREYHDSKEMVWSPYLYWQRQSFHGQHIRIGENGRRHTWSPSMRSSPNELRVPQIFVFGGSTTWGAGARDDFTIPSLLAKQMHSANIAVHVHNFGESGYVNTQSVMALMLELRSGNVPDIVVFYSGANDLFAALQAGHAGEPQNEGNRRQEFNLVKSRTRLASLFLKRIFKGIDRLASRVHFSETNARPVVEPKTLASEALDVYTGNLEVVEALSEHFGFEAFFYWQPSVFSKAQRTRFEDSLVELRSAREQETFLQASALIAESEPLAMMPHFANLTHVFDDRPDPVFDDFIHVSETGNAVIANAISRDLGAWLERGESQAPD